MLKNSELEAKLNELQKWFEENPKLPKKIDRLLLRRFLKCMFYDVADTKKVIELNYAMRNKHTHIWLKRDPEDQSVKNVRDATDLVPLPGLTPEGYKVLFFRLVDSDPSKMNSVEECKIFHMVSDCRFTMPDVISNEQPDKKDDDDKSVTKDHDIKMENGNDDINGIRKENIANDNDDVGIDLDNNNDEVVDDLSGGDVQIVDIGNYTMGHIARISFWTLRIYLKFLQEAFPTRLRSMHVINCPSFLDKMIAIVKPFVSDDVFKMTHFHTQGVQSLYEYVPQDMLPEEYGGKAGKLADLKYKWTTILAERRDYLMDPDHWVVEKPQTRSRWSWF